MAFLIPMNHAPRYIPAIKTNPESKELYKIRGDYAVERPKQFLLKRDYVLLQGQRIPEFLFPESATVTSAHKILPDIINLAGLGVSETLRDLIETLEPAVHQFHEVPVQLKSGMKSAQKYYAMVIMRIADDQVDFSAPNLRTINRSDGKLMVAPVRKSDDSNITINRNGTKGWHLWHSRDLHMVPTVSSELGSLMKRKKIRCCDYIQLNEI